MVDKIYYYDYLICSLIEDVDKLRSEYMYFYRYNPAYACRDTYLEFVEHSEVVPDFPGYVG